VIVRAWKTVEVECECDIGTEQIINEFSERVDESAPDYWRRLLPAIDCMTRALARISDDTIVAMSVVDREEVRKRLQCEAERWANSGEQPGEDKQ
jgi:hypothetical protein